MVAHAPLPGANERPRFSGLFLLVTSMSPPWSRGLPLDLKVARAAKTAETLRTDMECPWKSGRCPCRRRSEGKPRRPLHYDFPLRVGTALVSWAVPKGLSTTANEKRLAIRVDDHEVDYADFEGVIPEDEYGAGTVMIWDKGTYEPMTSGKDDAKTSMREAIEKGGSNSI